MKMIRIYSLVTLILITTFSNSIFGMESERINIVEDLKLLDSTINWMRKYKFYEIEEANLSYNPMLSDNPMSDELKENKKILKTRLADAEDIVTTPYLKDVFRSLKNFKKTWVEVRDSSRKAKVEKLYSFILQNNSNRIIYDQNMKIVSQENIDYLLKLIGLYKRFSL